MSQRPSMTHGENDTTVNCTLSPYEMDIEEGLQSANSCGRFQVMLQCVTMYLILTTGYQGLFSYFIFDDPSWKCVNSKNNTNSFCKNNFNKTFSNGDPDYTHRCKLEHEEWTYTTDKTYSAVTEFDLVCKYKTLAATSSSALYIGGLVGVTVAGKMGDSYGRKPVLIISLFSSITISIACGFVTTILQLTILRGLLGAFYVSYFTISYVLLMEYVAPKHRTMCGIMFNTMFALSLILMTGLAYEERKWRNLQIYGSLPCILALVILSFVPESPRWLLATQRNEEAAANLRKVASFNGRQLVYISLKTQISAASTYSYFDLVRYWKVALITSSQGLLWLTSAIIYYTIGLESSSMGGNMYTTFVYSQLAEIPSNLMTIFCCDRFGRKRTILGSMLIAGIFTGCIAINVGSAKYYYNLTLAILSKFFVTITYNGTYVWAFEVFPTVIRSQGVCVCSIMERIGGLLAPFLVAVLQKANPILPFIIMGVLGALSSLVGLYQPETNKMPTRELFDDFFEKPGQPNFNGIQNDKATQQRNERLNPMYENNVVINYAAAEL